MVIQTEAHFRSHIYILVHTYMYMFTHTPLVTVHSIGHTKNIKVPFSGGN